MRSTVARGKDSCCEIFHSNETGAGRLAMASLQKRETYLYRWLRFITLFSAVHFQLIICATDLSHFRIRRRRFCSTAHQTLRMDDEQGRVLLQCPPTAP